MHDVVVIGAGPAGAMAARRCALGGLKTLLVERAKLPRTKACGGMLWPDTVEVIEQEVGEIPQTLFVTAPLLGVYSHGVGQEKRDAKTIMNTWRRDLDYWLTEKALEAGAELVESTLFSGFAVEDDCLVLYLRRQGQVVKEVAKVLVGADGSSSVVRRCLYLESDFYKGAKRIYRPYYRGSIDIDLEWFHVWVAPEWGPMYASLVPKGELMAVGTSGFRGENLKDRHQRFKEFLTRKYGFRGTFLFAEGCLMHGISEPLIGEGDVLLVGDAAGLMREYGEGIFPAVVSGIEAGKATVQALANGRPAVEVYTEPFKRIAEEAKQSVANWLPRHQVLLGTEV